MNSVETVSKAFEGFTTLSPRPSGWSAITSGLSWAPLPFRPSPPCPVP